MPSISHLGGTIDNPVTLRIQDPRVLDLHSRTSSGSCAWSRVPPSSLIRGKHGPEAASPRHPPQRRSQVAVDITKQSTSAIRAFAETRDPEASQSTARGIRQGCWSLPVTCSSAACPFWLIRGTRCHPLFMRLS
ncbi:hypothetical protein ANO14919_142990 [Xylariales sp. No.14919]|nr:hypothetical protein ANO14919_142990 [Xylariales sp. No.14919]